jgi:N-acetylmuramoyl-L-alanine amidase
MVQFKVLFSIVLALELFGLANPVLAQTNPIGKRIIVIDPGHGGKDSGAVGINGIQEKDIVLKIAKQIVELNEIAFKNQFEIYLTRYTDTLISLGDRTKLAKILKADIFISLHCNDADNANARGIEVYVANSNEKHFQKSIIIAYNIQKMIMAKLGFESRGVKFANFQVLGETTNFCPSILLELGFLSNRDEANYVSEYKNLKDFALLLLDELYKIKSYE